MTNKIELKNKMDVNKLQSRPDIPCGSFIYKNGNLSPNLKDPAMKAREELKEKAEEKNVPGK